MSRGEGSGEGVHATLLQEQYTIWSRNLVAWTIKILNGNKSHNNQSRVCFVIRDPLDLESENLAGKPGLVPGLVPGIQVWKRPGFLRQTWDQAKSLKFILIDSIFFLSPCPDSTLGVSPSFTKIFFHTWCFPVFYEDFFFGIVKYILENTLPGIPRGKGDGGWKRVPHVCPKL
jgi:hypothetical protein